MATTSPKKAVKPAKKAAKPAKKATVAKTSPLKGMNVDAWVKAKVSGWQAEMVERLLRLARAAAPEASVTIKWAQPVFEQNGPFAWIKPAKAHVTFGFWRGAELSDKRGALEGGDRMKHLKIAGPDALDEALLTAFVREAVALNVAKGDPTRR